MGNPRKHCGAWAMVLSAVIVADSILTVFVGHEANPAILLAMSLFDLSLEAAMAWRLVYCAPLVCIIWRTGKSKQVLTMYLLVYGISAWLVLL